MITLATLPQASLQDIFTQARDHLLEQNCKSQKAHPHSGIKHLVCAYRGNNGTMCAVGCFISSEEYRIEMDAKGDTSFGNLLAQGTFPTMAKDAAELLAKLQIVHDQHEPDTWTEKLLELAICYNLEWV